MEYLLNICNYHLWGYFGALLIFGRVTARRNVNPALRIRDFYAFGLQVINEINFTRMHPDDSFFYVFVFKKYEYYIKCKL